MNAHAQPAHTTTTAAAAAFKAACQMEEVLRTATSLSRALMQFGTFDDIVADEEDQAMFLDVTGLLSDAIKEAERLRCEIFSACHSVKFPKVAS